MTQAERITRKFGGCRPLAKALATLPDKAHHRHWSVIYRWTWPRPKGYGGLIPPKAWPGIIKAARLYGVYLTEADFSIQETKDPVEEVA